ncbi:TPA: LLM class oxidoreductase [Klebsiella pneumoniae]|nr:LLM class oxidoreductase [Klebsiella pneumoniae]
MLSSHAGYSRVFQPGKLTFGFILPLESYPLMPWPTLEHHVELAQLADNAGFSSLWLRDVPFFDPQFGDTGQILDPFVYLGALANATKNIALGTTGIVLPLRDPVITAKQALSVDFLSGGRFILGLSTGDRPTEYPAFGIDFESRDARFRDEWKIIETLTQKNFPKARTEFYGYFNGHLTMMPKPASKKIPTIVVGRARQEISWIAEHSDGWLWHVGDFEQLGGLISWWRSLLAPGVFKPYGYATFFDLDENPERPLQRDFNGIRIGRKALISLWEQQQQAGVSHIALNLKTASRPANEILQEMAEFILPHFSS